MTSPSGGAPPRSRSPSGTASAVGAIFFPQRKVLKLDGHSYSPTILHRIVHMAGVVSSFDVAEEALKVVGEITGLARNEDIRAVRFDGPRGFVVTFKKTDPLFTFDLAQPEQPRVLGELKIPGFSTYMHFMDDDHLLTIGYDAEDHDSFAYFQGLMLQIFDISDLADPQVHFLHDRDGRRPNFRPDIGSVTSPKVKYFRCAPDHRQPDRKSVV